MARRIVALLALTLLVAGCLENGYNPTQSVQPSAPSACAQDFHRAAGAPSNADSVSDIYPAVRDCQSLAEWSANFDANNGAGFSGTATSVLATVCLSAEVKSEPLCAQVPPN